MKKFDTVQFKKAVTAAHANEAKLASKALPESTLAQRSADDLLTQRYGEIGLDKRKLAGLQKQHRAELQRISDEEDAAAVKRASRAKTTVHSSVESQTKALQQLTARRDFFPYPSVSLDKPFLVMGSPNSILWDYDIASFNSWAKFKVDTTAYSGSQKVSFFFLWSNDSPHYSVINAATYVSATGRIKCIADGGAHGIYSLPSSHVSAGASFRLWPWWQHPSGPGPAASTVFRDVRVDAALFDKSRSVDISHSAMLDRSMFIVPPNGVVVLEAAVWVGYWNDPGRAIGDFQNGSYRITCPVVVVSKLSGALSISSG